MKKRFKVVVVLLLVASILGLPACGFLGDPMLDDLWTRNIYPGENNTYAIGSPDYVYTDGYFGSVNLSGSNPLVLTGDGRVYLELRPDLDFETVRAHGKPTQVYRGIIHGFSLPIYNNDNEELYLNTHIPHRWDEDSDVLVHIHCYLDTANTDKRFNIEVAWEHFEVGDVVPNTVSANLTDEIETGTAPQYQSFHLEYAIDYDIDVGDELQISEELHFRLRRLDASQDEIDGEVVITHMGIVFRRDKLGNSIP